MADKAYALLRENPQHPSLFFKKLGGLEYWSARIDRNYRALAVRQGDDFAWFWIGTHDEYLLRIKKK